MKRLMILPLLLVLASCAGDTQTRATSALAIACDTYATVLENLTPRKASLSKTTVARIDATNKLVDPVCLPGSKINPAEVVDIVQNGIALLNAVKGTL